MPSVWLNPNYYIQSSVYFYLVAFLLHGNVNLLAYLSAVGGLC